MMEILKVPFNANRKIKKGKGNNLNWEDQRGDLCPWFCMKAAIFFKYHSLLKKFHFCNKYYSKNL